MQTYLRSSQGNSASTGIQTRTLEKFEASGTVYITVNIKHSQPTLSQINKYPHSKGLSTSVPIIWCDCISFPITNLRSRTITLKDRRPWCYKHYLLCIQRIAALEPWNRLCILSETYWPKYWFHYNFMTCFEMKNVYWLLYIQYTSTCCVSTLTFLC